VKLLAGLGNPGKDYERTRHNVGWMVLDEVARAAGVSVDRKKFNAEIGEGSVDGVKTLFVRPLTFMNLSGEAVGAAARFYKVPVEDVVVIHDDLDLEFGRVQVKVGGGHAGNNGIRSCIAHLGPDFVRIRVGIGKPGGRKDVVGHVLGGFDKREAEELPFLLGRAADAARCVLANGALKCMNEFNRREVPPAK
jgi:PTH1 family peptidyl-tRNA hydrolase